MNPINFPKYEPPRRVQPVHPINKTKDYTSNRDQEKRDSKSFEKVLKRTYNKKSKP